MHSNATSRYWIEFPQAVNYSIIALETDADIYKK